MDNLNNWTCESINRHFCNDKNGDCQKLCYMGGENMELHTIPIPDWIVFELLGKNKKVKDWFQKSLTTLFYGYGMNANSMAQYMAGKIETPITRRSVFVFHDYTLTDEVREDQTLVSIRAWVPTNELKYKDCSRFVAYKVKSIEHDDKTFNWFDYSEPISEFYFDHLATIYDLFQNMGFDSLEMEETEKLIFKARYYKGKVIKDELKEWTRDIKPLDIEKQEIHHPNVYMPTFTQGEDHGKRYDLDGNLIYTCECETCLNAYKTNEKLGKSSKFHPFEKKPIKFFNGKLGGWEWPN